jgi:hypothetical protein
MMTPLIATMSGLISKEGAFDIADFHWFELEITNEIAELRADLLCGNLPFPKVALVSEVNSDPFVVFVSQHEGVTRGTPFMMVRGSLHVSKEFDYKPDDLGNTGNIDVKHTDGTPFDYKKNGATGFIGFIAQFLKKLGARAETGYLPVKRANHAKRIRQGKVPLYDWNTIVVEPPKPKAEPQGGTHASPRWHERRGHWRNLKNNKRVWVRNCEVGNKARGAVFHDYVIKETV